MTLRPLLIALAALPLAACATVPPADTASAPAPVADERERLYALFERTDAAFIERNPLAGFFRGDFRRADQLGEGPTLEAFAAERRAAQDALAALRTIDRDGLSAEDRTAYDVFAYSQQRIVASTEPAILRYTGSLPIDHFNGMHISYPRLSTPGGQMPFATLADYDNALKRHAQFPKLIDRSIARLRAGMADGVVHPRIATETMIAQLDTQLALGTEKMPYWGAVAQMPQTYAAADRSRL